MMMVVFGLKSCDTCRKAMKKLENAEFRDIRKDGIPSTLLKSAYTQFGEDLVNRRSTTWRGLTEEERAMQALDLLTQHPALMKRPLICDGDRLYLGWGKDVQSALLG